MALVCSLSSKTWWRTFHYQSSRSEQTNTIYLYIYQRRHLSTVHPATVLSVLYYPTHSRDSSSWVTINLPFLLYRKSFIFRGHSLNWSIWKLCIWSLLNKAKCSRDRSSFLCVYLIRYFVSLSWYSMSDMSDSSCTPIQVQTKGQLKYDHLFSATPVTLLVRTCKTNA